MVNTGFMRWQNPDSTADIICLCCFKTIARAGSCAELLEAEEYHNCDPLEGFVVPQPDPLHGIYG
jgi:hypothetical protein